jgi:hypothetical protein
MVNLFQFACLLFLLICYPVVDAYEIAYYGPDDSTCSGDAILYISNPQESIPIVDGLEVDPKVLKGFPDVTALTIYCRQFENDMIAVAGVNTVVRYKNAFRPFAGTARSTELQPTVGWSCLRYDDTHSNNIKGTSNPTQLYYRLHCNKGVAKRN